MPATETSTAKLVAQVEAAMASRIVRDAWTSSSLFGGLVEVSYKAIATMDGPGQLWTVNGSQPVTEREAVRLICRTFGVELPSTGS